MNTPYITIVITVLGALFIVFLALSAIAFSMADKWKAAAERSTAAHAAEMAQLQTEYANQQTVTWPKPAKRLPASEVKRAFALEDDSPVWIALHQEIDDCLQDLFDDVTAEPSPKFTEEQRLHLAGGISEIRKLQKRLLDLHAAANRHDVDLEEEEEPAEAAA